jgi:hypothetical protein
MIFKFASLMLGSNLFGNAQYRYLQFNFFSIQYSRIAVLIHTVIISTFFLNLQKIERFWNCVLRPWKLFLIDIDVFGCNGNNNKIYFQTQCQSFCWAATRGSATARWSG